MMLACVCHPPNSRLFSGGAITRTNSCNDSPVTEPKIPIQDDTTQLQQLPDGVELTLNELKEMAARQQQQIENQQQLLVAKEQRLKFLKKQETRHQQMAAENERLRRLREQVEAQEMKLRKLRALRGQVDQQKLNNKSLSSDLDSIRALFNEKEKELSLAVAKVEELTHQLEELRRGRANQNQPSKGAVELEKLRRELMYRHKLNDQQKNHVIQQREALSQRNEEVSRVDKRIAELQERLHKKRLLNQQLANQINAATAVKQAHQRTVQQNQNQNKLKQMGTNIAAVEPFKHTSKVEESSNIVQDDIHAKLGNSTKVEDLSEFMSNKNDPKYQTLPYNTKFTVNFVKASNNSAAVQQQNIEDVKKSVEPAVSEILTDNLSQEGHVYTSSSLPTQTVHSTPAFCAARGHATAVHNQNRPSETVPGSQVPPSDHSMSTGLSSSQNLGNFSLRPFIVSHGSPTSGTVQNNLVSNCQLVRGSLPNGPTNHSTQQAALATSTTVTSHKHTTVSMVPVSPFLKPVDSVLPPTPLTAPPQKPISSVAPTAIQQPRPSPIYQTSSTPVTPVQPHTLSPTLQGILREVEDLSPPQSTSTPITNSESSQAEFTVLGTPKTKPALPPKPTLPIKPTPPPRQIHAALSAAAASNEQGGKIDTSPDAVDSALCVLRGVQQPKIASTSRYAGRTQIPKAAAQSCQQSDNAMPSDPVTPSGEKSNSQNQPSPTIHEPSEEGTQKKTEMPIKAKPLTIKKPHFSEQPKLKVMVTNGNVASVQPNKKEVNNSSSSDVANGNNNNNNQTDVKAGSVAHSVHISINRRIEMPPAFLFPEDETPPSDLIEHASVNSETKTAVSDVPDNAAIYPMITQLTLPYGEFEKFTLEDVKHLTAETVDNEEKVGETYIIDSEGNIELKKSSFGKDENENSEFQELPVSSEDALSNISHENLTVSGQSNGHSVTADEKVPSHIPNVVRRVKKGNLKQKGSAKQIRRVSFDPLALLLDASLEGELELVKKTAGEVTNPSAANDEGITALHNAICAGHLEIVKFLVEFGCDVNAQDSDGWTPLHCAASCNNLPMVKFLVEHGACIFATTLSDQETAAEKCEEDEEGFVGCSEYLYSVQEKLGIWNNGMVYAVYDYEAQNPDELSFQDGDSTIVLRKGDEFEREWWWCRLNDQEGYIPWNLLGLYPRVKPKKEALSKKAPTSSCSN